MSARAIANRRILHNITNMEEHEDELSGEKDSGGVDGLGDEKGVQADPTLSAASTTVSSTSKTVPLSAGENTDSRCQIDDSYRHVRIFFIFFIILLFLVFSSKFFAKELMKILIFKCWRFWQ